MVNKKSFRNTVCSHLVVVVVVVVVVFFWCNGGDRSRMAARLYYSELKMLEVADFLAYLAYMHAGYILTNWCKYVL
jgi:hypothetical protein